MYDLVPKDIFAQLPERYQRRAREIAERVEVINNLLVPCKPQAVKDAVLRLGGQLQPQPKIDIKDLRKEFDSACHDLPEWTLSEASNDFLAGRVANHTGQFMPTCAEFAKHARSIILQFLKERSLLEREAGLLLERARDEVRLAEIERNRRDPAVQKRVQEIMDNSRKSLSRRKIGIRPKKATAEEFAQLEKLKKPRQQQSTLQAGEGEQ